MGGGIYDTAVETRIQEEEEVTGNLLENMEESATLEIELNSWSLTGHDTSPSNYN